MSRLSPRQLADLLAERGGAPNGPEAPLLLDVREPWEFAVCRIEGSRLLPMGRIPAALGELDRERETVVICHHGIRSLQVARWLERQGFRQVTDLDGGLDAWARDIDPAMRTY
jgi:rhodanese-related sulfurtransferase